MSAQETSLRLPAFEVRQGSGGTLYSFVVDGKKVPEFASIARVARDDERLIIGYQRPEVLRHIREIRDYLESAGPIIPNAIVICFDDTVRFVATEVDSGMRAVTVGHLEVPTHSETSLKPGWIVDGQQRVAAIRDANIDEFPICVVAFVATSKEMQREQFILVNSTKPLPKGLIHELLPYTETKLAIALERRRFPAAVSEQLNQDRRSPMYLRIRTPTNPVGVIKDNSVLKMIENSFTEGALYRFRDPETGAGDMQGVLLMLHNFWTAVAELFEDAWEGTPRTSRLVHGAGIVSMGFVMDAIAERFDATATPSVGGFREGLLPLVDACYWTEGIWPFGDGRERRWNELQNTPRDIEILSEYLLMKYKRCVTVSTASSRTSP